MQPFNLWPQMCSEVRKAAVLPLSGYNIQNVQEQGQSLKKENGTFSFRNCPHWSLNEVFQCMGKMCLFVLFKGVKGKVTQRHYFTSIKSSRRKHRWKQLGLWRLRVYVTLMDIVVEKAMAPHSSTLAWKILWMEEPDRLQSMGLRRVKHNWATSLSFSLSCIGEGNGNPLQCSCLENPRDSRDWWAAVYGVTQSQTRLKRLSSSMDIVEKQFARIFSKHCGIPYFGRLNDWSQLFNLFPRPLSGGRVHFPALDLRLSHVSCLD